MKKTEKKIILVIFVGIVFVLSVYFNAYAVYSLAGNEILHVVTGENAVSEVPKIVVDAANKYVDTFIEKKEDLPWYARIGLFIDIYGLMQKAIDNDVVFSKDKEETVIRLKDESLIYGDYSDNNDYSHNAQKTKQLAEWLEAQGIDFLFAHAPNKEVDEKNAPAGISPPKERFSVRVTDSFTKNGVALLDLNNNKKLDPDVSKRYYRTDHHWTVQTGLLSTQYIIEGANRLYGYNLDASILDLSNFKTELYEDIFLGTAGRKIGNFYAGRDDFELYLPQDNTNYVYEIVHEGGEKEVHEGSFEEVFIFREQLEKDYYNCNPYCTYMGGDYPICTIVNRNAPSNKNILIIKDSYANTVAPFLSMAVEKITMIDLRYFKDSVKGYIENNKPDLVLVVYNTNAVKDDKLWKFN